MDTVTPVEQQPLTRATTRATPAWEQACLNCQAALSGPFCSECGQRAVPPHPKLSEIAGDAFAEFSGWDGKFSETIRLLVRKPGELTKQFVAGGRVRFISPVRLYLAMSFVYFVLAGTVADRATRPGEIRAAGINISSVSSDPAKGPVAVNRAVAAAQRGALTPQERDSALAQVARAPRIMQPLLRRGIEDPQGLKRTIVSNMPRVFFALLPVFAAILALFYRKHHYPEHLYFAIHLHSFAFFALMFVELATIARLDRASNIVGPLAMLWICAYTVVALRRVYGGTVRGTLAKCVGIGTLYLMASATATLGLVFWAALVA